MRFGGLGGFEWVILCFIFCGGPILAILLITALIRRSNRSKQTKGTEGVAVGSRPSVPGPLALDNAQAFYNKGNVHYKSSNLKQAIEDYTKAIELDPDFADAYYKRGNAYSDAGDLERAVADLDHFLELASPNLIRYASDRKEAKNKLEELKSKLGQ